MHDIKNGYESRFGILTGDVPLLVYGRPMTGRRYIATSAGSVTLEKQWSPTPKPFALQTCVRDLDTLDQTFSQYGTLDELFSAGSTCFVLKADSYGAMGKASDRREKGRVRLDVTLASEPDFTKVERRQARLTALTSPVSVTPPEEHGKRISIILDMGNAGLSSVDLPFIQVLINMFKLYYPDMLNYIIVFEMPWIMNAAWKIIKQMLPPKSHQIIKFASKKDIATLIRPEDCLERWGGENTWTFQYRREECEMPPSPFLGPRNNQVDKPDDDGASQSKRRERHQRRRAICSTTTGLLDIPSAAGDKAKSQVSDDSGASSEDLSDQSQEGADDTAVEIGGLLKISPGDEIQFASDAVEARRPLMLRNIRRGPVAFKVKTTAPEKFRVRPSCGVVAPGRRVSVELRLAPGVAAHQALAEKFLLVAAPIQQQQVVADDMASVWRLPCVSASSRV
ncbi:motile sperm domain-containing protein 2-like [Pollicipes pollicipes]|uniref:motile sperm domain-containing protein 2-like n=1 Tax=Pollicipes pollicipes TaxID=41117 RepID=UPI001884BAE5|nr:motile sperm domain-containing protein 2-like [Pollicipes pollicipes]